ncbi:MAG: LysR family transcriptional regulator [Alphaproteobacteria bacterium]|nr:LysR family transcriptional regulator [Alphaproteobacteria bacterium]
MNFAQLRAFHAVARELSFTRAARVLNVSQPTLSAQVKALEDSYGIRVFDRRGRRIQVTELGDALLDVTHRLFALEEEADELLAGARALTRGHLKVGADGPQHVIPLLAAFRRRHPNLGVSLTMGNADKVLADLAEYRTDVAMVARVPDDPRLFVLPYSRAPLAVFVAVDHPWAKRSSVRLADLSGQPVVLREAGSLTRQMLEQALDRAGIEVNPVMEMDSREAVAEAVAAGLGIGVVSLGEFGGDTRVRAIPIEGNPVEMTEHIVCLDDRRRLQIVRAFLALARELKIGP